jgi:purine nucleosidase
MPAHEIGIWEDEMPNPFPVLWRNDSLLYNNLPVLKEARGVNPEPLKAAELMERCLTNASSPMTIVCTGPLTVLAAVLGSNPGLASNIGEIVVMGGALNVAGNVRLEGTDGTAEWNVYCDPASLKAVLQCNIAMRFITLDVTQHLPVDPELVEQLSMQGHSSRASSVAAALWRLQEDREIYLWDPVTAMAVAQPELFRFEPVSIDVVTEEGPSLGQLIECPAGQGHQVNVATAVDRDGVYGRMAELLSLC